ncbi:XRE family transcriptional regulator [Dyella sp. M7H15-1]|uniref:helix-turn-helix transcriptional regulator n=1 Tax=Dyella sp. M7H15-1 TaxID=2501295 RepID=UPI001005235B|nr:helix-turn-helix transcriptional regulator [Dyella sp. M7H15-1]QAU22784.1 XRE family transcriptional regulator [Dyella sp. M7H15-1]
MKRKGIHSAEHRELVSLLFDLRRQADLTQAEAADALGRPQTYVSAVEVGRRGVDLLQIREFCAIYDVSFPEFAEHYEKRLMTATSQERPPRLSTRKRGAAKKVSRSKTAKGTPKGK